jgi:hypothetical protein
MFHDKGLSFCAALSAFKRRAASATDSVCTSGVGMICSDENRRIIRLG